MHLINDLFLFGLKHVHVHWKIEARELLHIISGHHPRFLNHLRLLNLFLLPLFLNLLERIISFQEFCLKLLEHFLLLSILGLQLIKLLKIFVLSWDLDLFWLNTHMLHVLRCKSHFLWGKSHVWWCIFELEPFLFHFRFRFLFFGDNYRNWLLSNNWLKSNLLPTWGIIILLISWSELPLLHTLRILLSPTLWVLLGHGHTLWVLLGHTLWVLLGHALGSLKHLDGSLVVPWKVSCVHVHWWHAVHQPLLG